MFYRKNDYKELSVWLILNYFKQYIDISKYFDIIGFMNEIKILKVLANETRRQILVWLKDPKRYFPKAQCDVERDGVCCGLIQEKAGLSQSTISHYLSLLEKAGLLVASRSGQWTYYKRNEKMIAEFVSRFMKNL